jgi:hypothetical protein
MGYLEFPNHPAAGFNSHPHHGQKLIPTEATGFPPIWESRKVLLVSCGVKKNESRITKPSWPAF